ncbi:hypothetical protein JW905_19465, partial [bacterium]|nr:hypothetical protein [candidate division CSSED10-310 bacterium]
WLYLGSIREYWEAHMILLGSRPQIDLKEWKVRSNPDDRSMSDRPPVSCGPRAFISNALIGDGAVIHGTVINSVLSPGVVVEEGAVVTDSIIMHDCMICSNSRVSHCVLDKDVLVGGSSILGGGGADTPITALAKATVVPPRSTIGRGCALEMLLSPEDEPIQLHDGESLV